MSEKKLSPVHPGEILQAEFLEPMGLSQSELARGLGVPPRRQARLRRPVRGPPLL